MKNCGSLDNNPSSSIHRNEWMSHFQYLFSVGPAPSSNQKDELEELEQCPMFTELNFRTSDNEILKAFKMLNVNPPQEWIKYLVNY